VIKGGRNYDDPSLLDEWVLALRPLFIDLPLSETRFFVLNFFFGDGENFSISRK